MLLYIGKSCQLDIRFDRLRKLIEGKSRIGPERWGPEGRETHIHHGHNKSEDGDPEIEPWFRDLWGFLKSSYSAAFRYN